MSREVRSMWDKIFKIKPRKVRHEGITTQTKLSPLPQVNWARAAIEDRNKYGSWLPRLGGR